MKIEFNKDEKIVKAIRDGLKRKDGYCPCRIQKTRLGFVAVHRYAP